MDEITDLSLQIVVGQALGTHTAMQAGNNIHYTAGRLQKRIKGCKLL